MTATSFPSFEKIKGRDNSTRVQRYDANGSGTRPASDPVVVWN